jgi:hypothetical protein
MVEAVVVLLCLSIYLFLRGGGKQPAGTTVIARTDNLKDNLEVESARLEKENEAINMDTTVSEELIIKKEIISAKLQSVKTAIEALNGVKGDESAFWDYFYNHLDKILSMHFTELMEITRETMGGASNESKKEEAAKQARALISAQKKQIIELLGYKEIFKEMNEEFSRIKAFNEKIMTTLEDQAVNSEELQQVLMDFEKVNKKMDKCVSVLDKGNESLTRQLSGYESLSPSKDFSPDRADLDAEEYHAKMKV